MSLMDQAVSALETNSSDSTVQSSMELQSALDTFQNVFSAFLHATNQRVTAMRVTHDSLKEAVVTLQATADALSAAPADKDALAAYLRAVQSVSTLVNGE